jgi:hypothetical protein
MFKIFHRVLAAETIEAGEVTQVGRIGNPMEVAPGANTPTTINGIDYSGHVLDQMGVTAIGSWPLRIVSRLPHAPASRNQARQSLA